MQTIDEPRDSLAKERELLERLARGPHDDRRSFERAGHCERRVNGYVVRLVDSHDGANALRELGLFWAPINQPSAQPVALTAYIRDVERRQAEAAGFQRHIPKPVQVQELVAAIDSRVR